MPPLLIRNARVLTIGGASGPRRGAAMRDLGVLPRADVLLDGGRIVKIDAPPGTASLGSYQPDPTLTYIDAKDSVLMPGFVDCHTHMCWAGSRIDEWERRLAGKSYIEIMQAGGGIMSTVRAVRETVTGILGAGVEDRARQALKLGSTTVEVKSGYGLNAESELKMLDAIRNARGRCRLTLVPTALLGHAIDAHVPGGAEGFVSDTLECTLPAVSESYGNSIAIDAFCETGAWSKDQCVRLFERARDLGHPIRVHTDQFTSLGMIPEAIRLNARSVDHLEAATDADLAAVARSRTIGVLLPCTGFHLDGRYAKARPIIDAGGAVAIATNANPGSSPCLSMPMAIALAVRNCGMTVAEAIIAATVNAAAVLDLPDRGYIAPGARADLILLRDTDERVLAYEYGDDPVETVIVGGEIVKRSGTER